MKTDEAIAHFKTKSALAKALRLTKGAISQWGPEVPPLRQHELEKLTNGALRANRLPQQIEQSLIA